MKIISVVIVSACMALAPLHPLHAETETTVVRQELADGRRRETAMKLHAYKIAADACLADAMDWDEMSRALAQESSNPEDVANFDEMETVSWGDESRALVKLGRIDDAKEAWLRGYAILKGLAIAPGCAVCAADARRELPRYLANGAFAIADAAPAKPSSIPVQRPTTKAPVKIHWEAPMCANGQQLTGDATAGPNGSLSVKMFDGGQLIGTDTGTLRSISIQSSDDGSCDSGSPLYVVDVKGTFSRATADSRDRSNVNETQLVFASREAADKAAALIRCASRKDGC